LNIAILLRKGWLNLGATARTSGGEWSWLQLSRPAAREVSCYWMIAGPFRQQVRDARADSIGVGGGRQYSVR